MNFLYFTDPMCSWCYGFGPELHKLVEAYRGKIGLEIIPGGLRAGETRAMSPSRAQEITRHWEAVHEVTSLPFKRDFFQTHPDYVYDTHPACRAINAAEFCRPGAARPYLERVQASFYAEGDDPTNVKTLVDAAERIGLSVAEFEACYQDPQIEHKTQAGFARFQNLGGMGFPLLLLHVGGKDRVVSIGYQPFKHLHCVVENILDRERTTARPRVN